MWHLDELKQDLTEVGIIWRLAFLIVAAFLVVHILIFIGFIILVTIADPVTPELFGFWIGTHIAWELIGGVVYWCVRSVYRILKWILIGE